MLVRQNEGDEATETGNGRSRGRRGERRDASGVTVEKAAKAPYSRQLWYNGNQAGKRKHRVGGMVAVAVNRQPCMPSVATSNSGRYSGETTSLFLPESRFRAMCRARNECATKCPCRVLRRSVCYPRSATVMFGRVGCVSETR